ncbi:hypothetical protein QJQ45_016516 [Haematococcus lacustris]|nr:hypothetical protein QJQ45_016516 [Haematococcus lacustris]
MAVPDATMMIPAAPSLRFALELVGPHNSAANSGRLLGAAALKYRLLQARGYLVVPISCKEWDKMGPYESLAKMMYLQSKLDRRLAALAATAVVPPPAGMAAGAATSAALMAEARGREVSAAIASVTSLASVTSSMDGGEPQYSDMGPGPGTRFGSGPGSRTAPDRSGRPGRTSGNSPARAGSPRPRPAGAPTQPGVPRQGRMVGAGPTPPDMGRLQLPGASPGREGAAGQGPPGAAQLPPGGPQPEPPNSQ